MLERSDAGTGCHFTPQTRDLADIERIAELEEALRSLVNRIRRVGGYSTPEDQGSLWLAEQLLSSAAPLPER